MVSKAQRFNLLPAQSNFQGAVLSAILVFSLVAAWYFYAILTALTFNNVPSSSN